MKRIQALFLAAVFLFSLASCSQKDGEEVKMEAGGVRLVSRVSAEKGSYYDVEGAVKKTDAAAFSAALRRDTEKAYRSDPTPADGRARGTVEESFATYPDAEGYLGFTVFNPLETMEGLTKTDPDGAAEEEEGAPRYIRVSATGNGSAVEEASLTAAYLTQSGVPLTLRFEWNAKGETVSCRVNDDGKVFYTAELLSATNGAKALLITNAGKEETTGTAAAAAPETETAAEEMARLFRAEAYFVKNGIFCTISASGEETRAAEIRRALMLAVNAFGEPEA
ncbi:MAG: hypothetical protein IJR89_07445 [Clostridia bacterium]|nr:hypothetical protein [Clostridia bacterium]